MDERQIGLKPETIAVLERRAKAVGLSSEDYAAGLLERVLDGLEMQDSVARATRRRLADNDFVEMR